MRRLTLTIAAAMLFPLGVGNARVTPPPQAALVDAKGTVIGNVRLFEGPSGVLLVLTARGMKPGWHGAHFHEVGDCSKGFQNAGGHILRPAPGQSGHGPGHGHGPGSHGAGQLAFGLLNEKTNDAGALPNIHVARDGTVAVELYSMFVSLHGRGGRPALRDSNGSSLIIHEGPEDQTGVAPTVGGRAACAAIR